MQATDRKSMRRTNIGRRWTVRLTGLGAIGAVLLMALSPSAAAVSTGLAIPGGTALVSVSTTVQGCSTEKVKLPTFNVKTGIGTFSATAHSNACSAANGGPGLASISQQDANVGVVSSVTLHSAASSVLVNFSVAAAASDSAHGKIGNVNKCPLSNFTASGIYIAANGSSAPVSLSFLTRECLVLAYYEVFVEAEVKDVTTGIITYGGSTFFLDNQTGVEKEAYADYYNFTTPGWTNISSVGTYNLSAAGSNSTSVSTSGSATIAGSWSVGDHLETVLYFFIVTSSEVYGVSKGTASAAFSAEPPSGGMAITGITYS